MGDAIIDDEDIKNKWGVGGAIWVCRHAEREREKESGMMKSLF